MTEIKKLSDIAEFINGGAWDQGSYSDKGIAVVRVSDVKNGEIDLSQCKFLKKELSEKYKKHQLQEDDLIICTVGSHPTQPGSVVGRTAVVSSEVTGSYLNQNAVLLRAKEGFDQKWLGFLGSNPDFHSYIKAHARGAASQVRMSISALKEMPIPSISLAQQKKSSDILDTYRSSIRNNLKKIKVLEKMAQTIYIEWFVNFRFPGHENVNLVDSKTDFGEIPEGWKIMKVEDLLERIQSGKKYDNKTVVKHGVVPVLDQGKKGTIGYHNDEPGIIASKEQPIIVFANHTCYQNLILYSFSTIQNVLPFLPTENRNIYWLHWATKDLIKFNDYKGHWPEFTSKKSLVPTAELTNKFGDLISPMVKLKYDLERQNKVLTETRDLLIPKLVTGEIEIKA